MDYKCPCATCSYNCTNIWENPCRLCSASSGWKSYEAKIDSGCKPQKTKIITTETFSLKKFKQKKENDETHPDFHKEDD